MSIQLLELFLNSIKIPEFNKQANVWIWTQDDPQQELQLKKGCYFWHNFRHIRQLLLK